MTPPNYHPEFGWKLFESDCGHRWVSRADGSYACRTCGRYDGDHHLVAATDISVHHDPWPEATATRADISSKEDHS